MESRTIVLLIGLTAGAISFPKRQTEINLDNWMSLFLPPILFCAGIMIEKQNFDRNRKIILIRGTIDSLMTFICISTGASYFFPKLGIHHLSFIDYLAIGAVFIPNNFIFELPASPFPFIEIYDDHSILFGESALSTATAIFLLKLIRRHDFSNYVPMSTIFLQGVYFFRIIVTSTFLGMLVGWLFSFRGWIATNIISKYIDSEYHLKVIRGTTAILFIPAYLTFNLAERLSLSGAVSVFSYGIAVSHYMLPKDTKEKAIWRDDVYRITTVAKWFSLTPYTLFIRKYYQWTNLGHRLGTFFCGTGMLFVLLILGRAVSVIPLSCCWWLGRMRSINNEEKKQINDDDEYNSNLANPWNCFHIIKWRWPLAMKIAKCHEPDILLFYRWGITNIAPQLILCGNVRKAKRYLRCVIWLSALMPSLVSYVLAYEQFAKSGDNQQIFVFNLVATVHLFITVVFSLVHNKTTFKRLVSFYSYPFPEAKLIIDEDGHEKLVSKWCDHQHQAMNEV